VLHGREQKTYPGGHTIQSSLVIALEEEKITARVREGPFVKVRSPVFCLQWKI